MTNNPEKKRSEYQVVKEGQEEILKVNCLGWNIVPSLEDSDTCMSRTIDYLIQNPSVGRIIFSQRRNFEYDYDQTQLLIEVATLYNFLIKQKKILGSLAVQQSGFQNVDWSRDIQYIIITLLRRDPLGAYVELKRILREEKIKVENEVNNTLIERRQYYISVLEYLYRLFNELKITKIAKPYLDGYAIGSRDVYKLIFRPRITPNFMYTQLMMEEPLDGHEVDAYSVGDNDVTVYKIPRDIKYLYHVSPPEFRLDEDKYELLELARSVLAEHKPKAEEFSDPDHMRRTFFNIGRDLLQELAESKSIDISYGEINELAEILVRYTVGFGLIEVLLNDQKIQDISVNSPIGQIPIYIVHEDYDECVTNIIPAYEDGEGWATKLRILSGRPLDEANPVLDTELILPNARARVAVMTNPLNPYGLAYALRRHRDKPWTLPLFIQNKMISPLGAGLLSFLIDGARTMLIAGTRGSGKTSFLDACMLEIMRKYRIITVEDTLELSVKKLRELGYNIQPMKVRAALMSGGAELAADEGIRTSLRFGDSCLIVGEVRSLEAKSLFEAMRVGALANVVAGTIHGASPYGVFDRIVNDLNVPRTSFKATDIIAIANPIKSADGLRKFRRIVEISEVRKHWEDDPVREQGFIELMKYDIKNDSLEASDYLKTGESDVIKAVASNVKEWAADWDAIWSNITLRAKIKEKLVRYAQKTKMQDLLEAEFVVQANDQFHKISDEVKQDSGSLNSKIILNDFDAWLKKQIKKRTYR